MRGRRTPSFWMLAVAVLVTACQPVGPGGAGTATGPPAPIVSPGEISREDEAEAERLYQSAVSSFEARRFFEVLRTTSEVLDRFPSSSASGAALLLNARAEAEVGTPDRADEAAEQYLALLPPGDARTAEVRILQAVAWQGRPAMQLDRLLRIGEDVAPAELEQAIALARSATDSLGAAELEEVLTTAPGTGPVAPIAQVRLAVDLLEQGATEEAASLARTALAAGPPRAEQAVAEGVLRGELPPARARVTDFAIGMVLPESGPPALADFAMSVAEGVEVAVATVLQEPFQVDLARLDDEANPALSALLASELELEGVVGAVGFLEDEALLAAGQSRLEGMPIVSPTARSADEAGEGVYSLEGPDPLAAAEIARYAADRAYQRVVVILPSSETAIEETEAFEAEAARFGVPVIERFYYEPGATFFETQIISARDALRAAEIAALGLGEDDTLRVEVLEPVGIFLPIPREDVEFLAPQISHFALDTLAVEVVGTSAWTDPAVLERVDPQYTDGVVATAPVGAGLDSPGMQRFRAAYEEYYQRSLVTTTPAIGYDAALLLLEALRPGRVSPPELLASFRALRDVEGATGIFSVVGDRIVRRTEVVRIRNRQLEPVSIF